MSLKDWLTTNKQEGTEETTENQEEPSTSLVPQQVNLLQTVDVLKNMRENLKSFHQVLDEDACKQFEQSIYQAIEGFDISLASQEVDPNIKVQYVASVIGKTMLEYQTGLEQPSLLN